MCWLRPPYGIAAAVTIGAVGPDGVAVSPGSAHKSGPFERHGKIAGGGEQRLAVRLVDWVPPGQRLRKVVENGGEQVMVQVDFDCPLLAGRAHETDQHAVILGTRLEGA